MCVFSIVLECGALAMVIPVCGTCTCVWYLYLCEVLVSVCNTCTGMYWLVHVAVCDTCTSVCTCNGVCVVLAADVPV